MEEETDGWRNKETNGGTDGRTEEHTDGQRNIRTDGGTDWWMNRRTDGGTDGWVEEQINRGWRNRRTDGGTEGWKEEQTDGGTDGWMVEQADGWRNRLKDRGTNGQISNYYIWRLQLFEIKQKQVQSHHRAKVIAKKRSQGNSDKVVAHCISSLGLPHMSVENDLYQKPFKSIALLFTLLAWQMKQVLLLRLRIEPDRSEYLII